MSCRCFKKYSITSNSSRIRNTSSNILAKSIFTSYIKISSISEWNIFPSRSSGTTSYFFITNCDPINRISRRCSSYPNSVHSRKHRFESSISYIECISMHILAICCGIVWTNSYSVICRIRTFYGTRSFYRIDRYSWIGTCFPKGDITMHRFGLSIEEANRGSTTKNFLSSTSSSNLILPTCFSNCITGEHFSCSFCTIFNLDISINCELSSRSICSYTDISSIIEYS